MTQTRWYTCGAAQRRNDKPCVPAPACKDWEQRHWRQGYLDADKAIEERRQQLLDSVKGAA